MSHHALSCFLQRETSSIYEVQKDLKALIKTAVEGKDDAKNKLRNRKPFKDGA
jgi:hypothetical protein